MINSASFLCLLLLLAFSEANQTNETSTVYIAVIVDPFVAGSEAGSDIDAMVRLLSLTNQSANDIFYRAVQPEARRRTRISHIANLSDPVPVPLGDSSIHKAVVFKPVFVEPGLSEDMLVQIEKEVARDEGARLGAILEMPTCSVLGCEQLSEMATIVAPDVLVVSMCCYYHEKHQNGDKTIANSMEPHSLVFLIIDFANIFKWRHYHFVVTPNWPVFDKFLDVMKLGFEEYSYLLQPEFGSLVVTYSYLCTEYLAAGALCNIEQAWDIVLREATATFVLLEPERDLPQFLDQLNQIDTSRRELRQGKAIFVIEPISVLTSSYKQIMSLAPSGTMVIRYKGLQFTDDKSVVVSDVAGHGKDSQLYSELRVLSRALEMFEQNRAQYRHLSDFYCGAKYTFDDSADWIGYSDHCDREFVSYEVLNVIRDGSDVRLYRVFVKENGTVTQVDHAYWFGSGVQVPYEDFCELQGAFCKEEADLDYIIIPSLLAVVFLTLILAAVLYCSSRRKQQGRVNEETKLKMVIIKFDDLHFDSADAAALNNISQETKDPMAKLRRGSVRTKDSRKLSSKDPPSLKSSLKEPSSSSSDPLAKELTLAFKQAAADRKKLQILQLLEKIQAGSVEGSVRKKDSKQVHFEEFKESAPELPQANVKSVMRARLYGDPVFVKRMRRQIVEADPNLVQELLQIQKMHHSNVNVFLGVTIETRCVFSVQQWCAKGTLASMLAKRRIGLDKLFKISFVNDIANGMSYLHQSSVGSHGRLKPENILIDARWMCKIANIPLPVLSREDAEDVHSAFDAFRMLREPSAQPLASSHAIQKAREYSEKQSASMAELLDKNKKFANLGFSTNKIKIEAFDIKFDEERDFYYTAPELLRIPRQTRPIRGSNAGDVYSFGLLCYEVLTREKPFANTHLPPQIICEKLRKRRADAVDFRPRLTQAVDDMDDFVQELWEIAEECWKENPVDRPTFQEIARVTKNLNGGKENHLIDQMMEVLELRSEFLEDNIQLRMEELTLSKNTTQELLTKLLPKFVVEEMQAGRIVSPRTFDSATVFVCHVLGVADLATTSESAAELVRLIDAFSINLDKIIESKDAYKIEQNGGTLRIVSGLPKPNSDKHASIIATMALEIMASLSDFLLPNGDYLQLCCGIHSGPVTAGVVGLNVPQYSVFGDTLDVAVEMAATAKPLQIHISPETKALLDQLGGFTTRKRVRIHIKKRGVINTYLLTGRQGFKQKLPDWTNSVLKEECNHDA